MDSEEDTKPIKRCLRQGQRGDTSSKNLQEKSGTKGVRTKQRKVSTLMIGFILPILHARSLASVVHVYVNVFKYSAILIS